MKHYKIEKEKGRLWLIEDAYSPLFEEKTEAIFAQCNGYMGVRAAHPFLSIEEKRGMFLRGAFDKAYDDEATELVNCPDVTWFGLEINEEKLHTDSTKMLSCERRLDVLSGELQIRYVFELALGRKAEVECRRFASANDRHLFLQSYRARLNGGEPGDIRISTGINGQITNSGVSHFHSVSERVYDREIMESIGQLKKNAVVVLTQCTSGDSKPSKTDFVLKRRSIYGTYCFDGVIEVEICKVSVVFQTGEMDGDKACGHVRRASEKGYDRLFHEHVSAMRKFWEQAGIRIRGMSVEQEAAVCFSQYHIFGMTPYDTEEFSIAAKGLTGEGYKGHVFWDTEIFLFPFWLHVCPEQAKRLLGFRYIGLDGARKKAKDYGYKGAMFPWEAAGTGEEETPLYAALNIHTGKANKVWSGIKEYHVTADIVYAVERYYEVTGNWKFMEKRGYEIIFEAARFWVSCAEKDEKTGMYVIRDVIGPDEYTEHVDNNAYTNYMAAFCVKIARKYAVLLKKEKPVLFEALDKKTGVSGELDTWERFLKGIYLPQPDRNGIIPQDDTFLSKPMLKNIEKYRSARMKQAILLDYSREEIVNMQVLKQADVVMLMNLFPWPFMEETVRKNVLFYEKRTVHDSSLSYCAYAQASAHIGDREATEKFFENALFVDLNDNPLVSGDGIHAASMGGVWNCLIYGFAGVWYEKGKLSVRPHLPDTWQEMEFKLIVRGIRIRFCISHQGIIMESEAKLESSIHVEAEGKEYEFQGYLNISRKREGREEWNKRQREPSLTWMG